MPTGDIRLLFSTQGYKSSLFFLISNNTFSYINYIQSTEHRYKMVHLAQIKKQPTNPQDIANRLASVQLDTPVQQQQQQADGGVDEGADNYCSSVYGSRFAVQQMPSTEMPEREMPRDVAYRLIKDELSLDGNPMLKYVVLGPLVIGYGEANGVVWRVL